MKEVIVYTKDNCPACKMTKKILGEEGIKYIDKNISLDADTHIELKMSGFISVPVIKVEGMDPIIGFQPEKLRCLKEFLEEGE